MINILAFNNQKLGVANFPNHFKCTLRVYLIGLYSNFDLGISKVQNQVPCFGSVTRK